MAETRHQYYVRRSVDLNRRRKSELCALYRKLGGLGGTHPPEKWTREEVIASIAEMEWGGLPEDQKKPDPPRLTPPCGTCGQGQGATAHGAKAHREGTGHNYAYTHDPSVPWVPESEDEAARIERLGLVAGEGRD